MNNKKNYSIVNLRFLAIILVLIGHSLIIYKPDWKLYSSNVNVNDIYVYIEYFIYLFHMPLFFAISGFLFYKKEYKIGFGEFVKKKAKRLLIPYLFVAFFWLLPIRYICKYQNYLGHSLLYNVFINIIFGKDNGHLWYLISLFIIFVFSFLIEKYIKNKYAKTIIIIILTFSGFFLPTYLGTAFNNIIWFYLGKSVAKYKLNIKISYRCSGILSFSLLIIYFVALNMNYLHFYKYIIFIIKYMFCFFFILFLFNIISNKKIDIVEKISDNSLGMYLFHSPIIYISFCYYPNINPICMFVINFFIFGTISYIITIAIKKSKLKVLIGG